MVQRVSVMDKQGRVTIYNDIREQFDLEHGSVLLITVEKGRIVLTPTTLVPRVEEVTASTSAG